MSAFFLRARAPFALSPCSSSARAAASTASASAPAPAVKFPTFHLLGDKSHFLGDKSLGNI